MGCAIRICIWGVPYGTNEKRERKACYLSLECCLPPALRERHLLERQRGGIWGVFGGYLGGIWGVFEGYLGGIWGVVRLRAPPVGAAARW